MNILVVCIGLKRQNRCRVKHRFIKISKQEEVQEDVVWCCVV